MNKQLSLYVILTCAIFALPAQAHYQDYDSQLKEPQNLCEAIEQGKREAYDRFIAYQGTESCSGFRNPGETSRSAETLLGLFVLPLAPFFWYSALHESPETPLSAAVWNKQLDMIDDLLNRHVDVNRVDQFGYTPLHWACSALTDESTYQYIVRKLLDHGAYASLNTQDKKGRTPLHWAYIKGNQNIANFLMQHGAQTYVRDNDGKTPFDYQRELDTKYIAR